MSGTVRWLVFWIGSIVLSLIKTTPMVQPKWFTGHWKSITYVPTRCKKGFCTFCVHLFYRQYNLCIFSFAADSNKDLNFSGFFLEAFDKIPLKLSFTPSYQFQCPWPIFKVRGEFEKITKVTFFCFECESTGHVLFLFSSSFKCTEK